MSYVQNDIINKANEKKILRLEQARANYAKRKEEGRLKYAKIPKEEQQKRGPKPKEEQNKEQRQLKKRGRKPLIINDVSDIPQYLTKLIKNEELTQ